MNISHKAIREDIFKLLVTKKIFTLHIPSAGYHLRPNYNFNKFCLARNTIVGVKFPMKQWFEIGEIIGRISLPNMCEELYYKILPFQRISEIGVQQSIQIMPYKIACIFERIK